MRKKKILIIEDEILIAHSIVNYLEELHYEVVDIAISYDEAITILNKKNVDLVLIDIILYGKKTGIDIAYYINEYIHIPFIYLTAQLDSYFINQAKETYPSGYLTKPIQKTTLFSTIEMITINIDKKDVEKNYIFFKEGKVVHKLKINSIDFIQADHVYIKIFYLERKHPLMIRQSLQNVILQLPNHQFHQTHKSYLVNLSKIDTWTSNYLTINQDEIPISRNRRKETIECIKSNFNILTTN